MDFESPDVEKEFPGLYASESGRKSNESDFSDGGDHEKPSKKHLLGRSKDKKEKKDKDRGYAALEGESSPEEDTETKSPSKSKKTKSFKFPSKSKEKREKSRDKEKPPEELVKHKDEKEKKKEKEREKEKKEKEKKEKLKEKDKEKEEKAKFKLESKEKLRDKDEKKVKEKDKDKVKEKDKEKDKVKEKEKEKVKEKDKEKKEKKLAKVPSTVTAGVPFEEIFTLGVAMPIFGVPLQTSVDRSRCHDDAYLPLIVRDAIDFLELKGLRSPQLYRAEPDRVKLQQLRKLYTDREPAYHYHWDVPVACHALKAFLSELPESILTQELSCQFEQATAMAEPQRDVAIASLVARLPRCNRSLLGWLALHFRHVVDQEPMNNVSIQTLAAVMGAALNMSLNLLTYFITKAEKLFPDVTIIPYVPPLQTLPPKFLENASQQEIMEELRMQESMLSQIHAEMHAGFVTPAREERLWEGQRIVTQLKRKLRSVQKSTEPTTLSVQPSLDDKLTDNEPACSSADQVLVQPPAAEEPPKSPIPPPRPDVIPTQTDDIKLEKQQESPKSRDTFSDEAFDDDFDFSLQQIPEAVVQNAAEETSPEKPKLSDNEIQLLRLRLENAEYLQLKSILQAKINSEQFEIVKLRSQVAVKNKHESSQNKDFKNVAPEDLELKQKLLKENAMLEQKRLNLINQIFQERIGCMQLKIDLAMKEIM